MYVMMSHKCNDYQCTQDPDQIYIPNLCHNNTYNLCHCKPCLLDTFQCSSMFLILPREAHIYLLKNILFPGRHNKFNVTCFISTKLTLNKKHQKGSNDSILHILHPKHLKVYLIFCKICFKKKYNSFQKYLPQYTLYHSNIFHCQLCDYSRIPIVEKVVDMNNFELTSDQYCIPNLMSNDLSSKSIDNYLTNKTMCDPESCKHIDY
ncbi:hypothetical protein BpHYR1_025234 [Brachionus plicatilis]|uniref:Uncharacterized protein n=1 Tax=Brachionus plicatilis TaxID=10195 RepID=A0A3M7TAG5_BRAPC|nr:hypothetical protein BpHYR1_025234 [Brachionus plicatilis]